MRLIYIELKVGNIGINGANQSHDTRQETRSILHLSLRLKRAIFILRKAKGEVEYLVVGDTLYLVTPLGEIEPKVAI